MRRRWKWVVFILICLGGVCLWAVYDVQNRPKPVQTPKPPPLMDEPVEAPEPVLHPDPAQNPDDPKQELVPPPLKREEKKN